VSDDEFLLEPDDPCGTGVLVLSGSSGALELERAGLFAAHGATALALRWFGGVGQPAGPWEVPVETFTDALSRLAPRVDRLALVGTSFGAEAALLTAVVDARVTAVVAVAPSPVVWAGVTDQGRVTSHWTWGGEVVPFVPFDDAWRPDTDPPAFRRLYERSLETYADRVPAATIPVERARAELVLIGGEDDQVWPGAEFARRVATRRLPDGPRTTVVTHPDAGHRVVLPGERQVLRGQRMARGGTPEADAALGAQAWPAIVRALRLGSPQATVREIAGGE
jgi:dienelactone hydrolase